MSKKEKLIIQKIQKIEQLNSALSTAKQATEIVPEIQDKIKKEKAEINFLENAPEDLAEEIAQQYQALENYELTELTESSNKFSATFIEVKVAISSTGVTGSSYLSSVQTFVDSRYDHLSGQLGWIDSVSKPLILIAENRSKKEIIPKSLDNLCLGLGDSFIELREAAQTAITGIGSMSNSLSGMRNFISSFWGRVTEYTKRKEPNKWRGVQKQKLKDPSARKLVAEILSSKSQREKIILLKLDELFNLYQELSSLRVGKNVEYNDASGLQRYLSRWILLLDEILGLVDINPGD